MWLVSSFAPDSHLPLVLSKWEENDDHKTTQSKKCEEENNATLIQSVICSVWHIQITHSSTNKPSKHYLQFLLAIEKCPAQGIDGEKVSVGMDRISCPRPHRKNVCDMQTQVGVGNQPIEINSEDSDFIFDEELYKLGIESNGNSFS